VHEDLMLKKPRLSDAQWRLLCELEEPNQNPDREWYFPEKNLRTLQKLQALGYARHVDSDQRRHGYAITPEGRARYEAGR
jgi:hypothetical protein